MQRFYILAALKNSYLRLHSYLYYFKQRFKVFNILINIRISHNLIMAFSRKFSSFLYHEINITVVPLEIILFPLVGRFASNFYRLE